jgi:hypothetical protein
VLKRLNAYEHDRSSQSSHLILMPVDCNERRLQAARHCKMKFVSQPEIRALKVLLLIVLIVRVQALLEVKLV